MTEFKENIPEEISSREQFIKDFIIENEIGSKKLKGKSHLMFWKINIGNLQENQIEEYLSNVQEHLSSENEKLGFASFYIATQEETSLTIVDLKTMKYVKM